MRELNRSARLPLPDFPVQYRPWAPARRPAHKGVHMLKVVRRSAVHGVCAAATLALSPITATAQAEPDRSGAQAFPALPLPPPIEGLIGMPQTYTTAQQLSRADHQRS